MKFYNVQVSRCYKFPFQRCCVGRSRRACVPMGEKMLFSFPDILINLGGIANITIRGSRYTAFDVCFCNMALNYLAQRDCSNTEKYDTDGKIAESGKILENVLGNMDNMPYFKEIGPKSLSREDFEKDFLPLLDVHVSIHIHIRIRSKRPPDLSHLPGLSTRILILAILILCPIEWHLVLDTGL